MEELPLHSIMLKYYFTKGLPYCYCPKLLDRSTVVLGTGKHGEMCLRVKKVSILLILVIVQQSTELKRSLKTSTPLLLYFQSGLPTNPK